MRAMARCQQPHRFCKADSAGAATLGRFCGCQEPRGALVALERCIQPEDVTDLKGGAVVHHEVATDNYVYVVRRRRRKHHFQLTRARLYLLLQSRRQSSIHNQLALQPGRQMITFRQTRRQTIVISAVPVADVPVMILVVAPTLALALTVPVAMIVRGAVIVVTIVLAVAVAVAVAIALGQGESTREHQRQQRTCASTEQACKGHQYPSC